MENNKLLSYQIQEYIEKYLKLQRDVSINTLQTYSYGLLQFINFLKIEKYTLETFEVKHINYQLVMKFIEYLKNKNNSSRTINNRITILKSFLEYVSYKEPSVIENYRQIKVIKKLKEEEKIHEYFTKTEVKLILKESQENIKYLCILSLLYDCALRVSELCNLKKENLILDKNNPVLIIENGKGRRSRTIPLSKENVSIIKKYLNTYKSNNYYLFENKYKVKYASKGITYILKKYYNEAKKKSENNSLFRIKPHCHMMRHSKGVHLVDDGVPLTIIKELFGHKNLATTEIYARISSEKKREILEKNSINKSLKTKRPKKEILELEEFLRKNAKINQTIMRT